MGGKEIPKLDVAGSIPVARSNDDAGLQGTCSPAFASMLPLCARSHRVSPMPPVGSRADKLVGQLPQVRRRPDSRLDVTDGCVATAPRAESAS
jgi:hypothetical protein